MSRDTILTDEASVRHSYDNLRTQGWLDGHASGLDAAAEFLRKRAVKLFFDGKDDEATRLRRLTEEMVKELRPQMEERSKEQPGQEEILSWIAVLNGATDYSVTWHTTRVSIKLDGMSNVVAPKMILALCSSAMPCHQISRTSRSAPKPVNHDIFCGSCAQGEAARATARLAKEPIVIGDKR